MDIISNYFPHLTPQQVQQFGQLQSLYEDWNAKVNLISRKDIANLYVHHVLHSLSIAKLILFKPNTTLLDVGTGGGFPGIPLAIMNPEAHFHLIDSIGKKIKVVDAVAKALMLKNVTTEKIRAEEVNQKFDFITGRAITNLFEFYGWVNRKVKKESFNVIPNGIIYLKGSEAKEEIQQLSLKYSISPISTYFSEEYFKEKFIIHIRF